MPIKDLQKRKEYWINYNKKNRAFVNKLSNNWRKNNPERAKEIQQKYREVNKEKVLQSKNRWADANPEKLKQIRRDWYLLNKDRKREYTRKRRNIQFDAEGSHTQGEWETLKKQYGYTCPSCHLKEPEIKLTEDHIIPLVKGGSDFIENIQPLCGSCNCKKHTKTIKYE